MSEDISHKFHDSAIQKTLYNWWEGLEEHHRGDRPELRRCRNIDDVLMSEAYHRARRLLAGAGFSVQYQDEKLANVIGLFAHVRTHQKAPKARSLAVQMASGGSAGEGARVSGLRFRRLLQVRDRDELYARLMGVIRLLDQTVDINLLARDVFYWSADTGNRVRRQWATDYWAVAPQET